MARSHPPTLIRLVSRCLEQECALTSGVGILAAVSGGPDSMALLHVLSLLAPKQGFRLYACGIDHGLREGAAAELDLAQAAAAKWGVPFERRSVALTRGANLQARARTARYEALRQVAAECKASLLAVAHHLGDRAETVLLRLLRGAGPRGLSVLAARSGDVLRPMIRARRADVERHLARHRIESAQDPSNRDPRFLRTRVRHELLPLLSELSPNIEAHLAALSDQLAEAELQTGAQQSQSALWDPQVGGVPLNREQAAQLRRAVGPFRTPGQSLAPVSSAPGKRRASTRHVPLSKERVLVLDATSGLPQVHRRSGRQR